MARVSTKPPMSDEFKQKRNEVYIFRILQLTQMKLHKLYMHVQNPLV